MELSDDLDRDTYVENIERGLVVAERFTGAVLTQDFVTNLMDAGVSYLVLPWLPDHQPFVERSDYSFGPLLNEKHTLLAATEQELRDITWWTVGEIARHYGADDPEVAASLQSRSFSPTAVLRARRAEVFRDPAGPGAAATWRALHSATNPDPVAALVSLAAALKMPLPWEVATLASLRRRLTDPAEQGTPPAATETRTPSPGCRARRVAQACPRIPSWPGRSQRCRHSWNAACE